MKSIRLLSITAMTVFAGLAIPVRLATRARNQQPPNYTVTDLGTLGGDIWHSQWCKQQWLGSGLREPAWRHGKPCLSLE